MLLGLRISLIAASFYLFGLQPINAQSKKANKKSIVSYPETLYSSLQYRSIGPYRGGRSSAVTGVEGKPNLFYFGAAGGGFWKTENGGETYENISDGYFGGSIGSILVSKSDNDLEEYEKLIKEDLKLFNENFSKLNLDYLTINEN